MVTSVSLPFVAVYSILKGSNSVVIASTIVISELSFIMAVRVL